MQNAVGSPPRLDLGTLLLSIVEERKRPRLELTQDLPRPASPRLLGKASIARVITPEKVGGRRIHVSAAPYRPELGVVPQRNGLEEMVSQVLGDDRSGRHGDVVLFAEIAGFEMRVVESQEAEDLGAVSDDALDRGASTDNGPRR